MKENFCRLFFTVWFLYVKGKQGSEVGIDEVQRQGYNKKAEKKRWKGKMREEKKQKTIKEVIDAMMESAERYEPDLIAIRRDLHRYPETAWAEFRTTAQILSYLRKGNVPFLPGEKIINPRFVWSYLSERELHFYKQRATEQGIDPKLIKKIGNYTGGAVIIETKRPGPVIAFRFDIDCNDIEETKDRYHIPNQEGFASVNPGCMHACGHDGHTAMGMVLARILWEQRQNLSGTIKILFQPAEEGDKGAQSIVESGILDDVDVVLGIHIFGTEGEYPALAGTQAGLYATTKFDVIIEGKSAHAGAAPQEGSNAVMTAVTAISAMGSFLQDGRGSTRLNIGTIQGGTGRNIIPARCFFRGETRGADTQVEKRLYNRVIGCVKHACEMFDCSYHVKIMGYGPAGGGDEDMAAGLAEQAKRRVPELKWTEPVQVNTGSTDDFAYMMAHVQKRGGKACYMALLSHLKDGLHSSGYDFDEKVLKAGVKSCIAALEYIWNVH